MDDPKTQLSQLLQKQCGRALNKDDVVYLCLEIQPGLAVSSCGEVRLLG